MVFVAVFLLVAVWESVRPLAPLREAAELRWPRNGLPFLIMLAIASIALRLSPVAVAAAVAPRDFPSVHQLPAPLAWTLTLLLLDSIYYWVHRAGHAFRPLWRMHAVHHSDADYDVTTALRFHPLEPLVNRVAHLAGIALLAPPTEAVIASQLLTTVLNLTAHANAALPAPLSRLLRWLFITPDLHRVHHSILREDYDCNFGQSFSLWDRLFGTYREKPAGATFATGLEEAPGGMPNLVALLAAPFRARQ